MRLQNGRPAGRGWDDALCSPGRARRAAPPGVPWLAGRRRGGAAAAAAGVVASTNAATRNIRSGGAGASWVVFSTGRSSALARAGRARAARCDVSSGRCLVMCVPLAGLVRPRLRPLFVCVSASSHRRGVRLRVCRQGGLTRGWAARPASSSLADGFTAHFRHLSLPAHGARCGGDWRLCANRCGEHDQMEIITWFQGRRPREGYGLARPWCGEVGRASCAGLPRQIQSATCIPRWSASTAAGRRGARRDSRVLARKGRDPYGRANARNVAPGSPVPTHQAWASWIAVAGSGAHSRAAGDHVAGQHGWLPALTAIHLPVREFSGKGRCSQHAVHRPAINMPEGRREDTDGAAPRASLLQRALGVCRF